VSSARRGLAALPRWVRLSTGVDSSPPPNVLMVSWLGARREHFDHYEALYKSRGYTTLAIVPPLHVSLLPSSADAATADFLSNLPPSFCKRGMLLHVASHGGFLFLSQLLRAAAQGQPKAVELVASTRGLFLDSSPLLHIDGDVAARALASIAMRKQAKTSASGFLTQAMRVAIDTILCAPPVQQRLSQLTQAWDAPDNALAFSQVPITCAYSVGDVLVPPQGIEAWAHAKKQLGWNVRLAPFPAHCPHVELLRYEPQLYGAVLDAWLGETASRRWERQIAMDKAD
jgi:Eukaryotic protein of unknown function (DUF829)